MEGGGTIWRGRGKPQDRDSKPRINEGSRSTPISAAEGRMVFCSLQPVTAIDGVSAPEPLCCQNDLHVGLFCTDHCT